MPNLAKSLGCINCYSTSCSRLLKALAILSHLTVRRCETMEIRKNIFGGGEEAYYLQESTNHRKKISKVVVFSCNLFPNILNKYILRKQDYFRHLLKS